MADILNVFQKPSVYQKQFIVDNKVEILDYGNVEAIKAGIKDPKQMAEYMEQLRREREGLPPKEEGEETPQTEEAKTEAKQEPPQAPVPDLSIPRQPMKAKATLFAM